MGKNMIPNKSSNRQVPSSGPSGIPPKGGRGQSPHGGQAPAGSVRGDGTHNVTAGNSKRNMAGNSDTDSIDARQAAGAPDELRMAGKKEASVGTSEY